MLRRWPTVLLVTVGLALIGIGVERVLATASGAGLVATVVVGALLLVTPFALARFERLTTPGAALQLTRDMAGLGAPRAAHILERTDLARFADAYTFMYAELDDDRYIDATVHLQDLLVERAAAMARKEKFDPAEIRALAANASPAMRALALGFMKGDSELADGGTVLAAIADPHSISEQYQGLELAKLCWPHLTTSYRSAIRSVIEASPAVMSGHQALVQEILALPVA